MNYSDVKPGVPYTCKDCPGRLEQMTEATRWRLTANSLAKQLGKIEYAQAAYDDLWSNNND